MPFKEVVVEGKRSRADDLSNYNVTENLRDHRKVTIRAVRPDDKGLVIEGLKAVSPESIYRRFFTPKREISASGLKLVTEVDFINAVALIAVIEKDGNEQIAGGGRYVRTSEQRAEVAFLIADPFHGLGIASLIFKHLLAIARNSGITHFEANVLPSNDGMFKVFTRSGIPMKRKRMRDYVHVLMELTSEASGGMLKEDGGPKDSEND